MTKTQIAYAAWKPKFIALCEKHSGTLTAQQQWIGAGISYDLPTTLGILRASIHAPSPSRKRPKWHIEQIFLRFETFSTGKVYDTLCGYSFNGYSGKWNILLSGANLETLHDFLLVELEHRLELLEKAEAK